MRRTHTQSIALQASEDELRAWLGVAPSETIESMQTVFDKGKYVLNVELSSTSVFVNSDLNKKLKDLSIIEVKDAVKAGQ